MKKQMWIGAGLLAVIAAAGLFFFKRGAEAAQTPEQIANDIVSGKPIIMGDGAKILGHSPATEYFALKTSEERKTYLDKVIDQQEEMRKKIEAGEIKLPGGIPSIKAAGDAPEADDKGQTSIKRETSADGREQKVTIRLNGDDLSPALRAQMQELHAALRNRRKERGLDPDAPLMIVHKEEVHTTK